MTESTWKIQKLDWKTPGKLLENSWNFFLPKVWEPCARTDAVARQLLQPIQLFIVY